MATTEEMVNRFLTSKKATGVSAATLKWYRCLLFKFVAWLDAQSDQQLTDELIERYIVHMRDSGLARVSVHGYFTAIRSFFTWCKRKKLIRRVPTEGVRVDKPKSQEIRRATKAEVNALLEVIPVHGWMGLRDYLIIHLLFYAGLRVGELVRLEPHHFDLGTQVLTIPDGKSGSGAVPLLRDVIEAYLAYMTHRPKGYTDRLLVASDGHGDPRGAISTEGVRQIIARRCTEAGIRRLTPHDFRRGLGMYLLNQARADMSVVQRILRHSDIKVTNQAYARWQQDSLADEFRQKMEATR